MTFWETMKRLFGIGDGKTNVLVTERKLTVGERIWNGIATLFGGSKYKESIAIEDGEDEIEDLPQIPDDAPSEKQKTEEQVRKEAEDAKREAKAKETPEEKQERRRKENIDLIRKRMSPRAMGLPFTEAEEKQLLAQPDTFTKDWEMPKALQEKYPRAEALWNAYREFTDEISYEISDDVRARMYIRSLSEERRDIYESQEKTSALKEVFRGYWNGCKNDRKPDLREMMDEAIHQGKPQKLEKLAFGRARTPVAPEKQEEKGLYS